MPVCRCNEYKFPHRHGGGWCQGHECYCSDCHAAFRAEDVVHKHVRATWGYDGGSPPEDYYFCPECGSEDFLQLDEDTGEFTY